jgi:glutamate decarboxylase
VDQRSNRFSLYDLADRLRVKGWQVPTYPMPANRRDLVVPRVVARLGVSRDLAGLLVEETPVAITTVDHDEDPLAEISTHYCGIR